jgi:hypothetical protein
MPARAEALQSVGSRLDETLRACDRLWAQIQPDEGAGAWHRRQEEFEERCRQNKEQINARSTRLRVSLHSHAPLATRERAYPMASEETAARLRPLVTKKSVMSWNNEPTPLRPKTPSWDDEPAPTMSRPSLRSSKTLPVLPRLTDPSRGSVVPVASPGLSKHTAKRGAANADASLPALRGPNVANEPLSDTGGGEESRPEGRARRRRRQRAPRLHLRDVERRAGAALLQSACDTACSADPGSDEAAMEAAAAQTAENGNMAFGGATPDASAIGGKGSVTTSLGSGSAADSAAHSCADLTTDNTADQVQLRLRGSVSSTSLASGSAHFSAADRMQRQLRGSASYNSLASGTDQGQQLRGSASRLPYGRYVVGRQPDKLLPASEMLLRGLERWPEAGSLRRGFDEVIDSFKVCAHAASITSIPPHACRSLFPSVLQGAHSRGCSSGVPTSTHSQTLACVDCVHLVSAARRGAAPMDAVAMGAPRSAAAACDRAW